jgi:hypothetical protein
VTDQAVAVILASYPANIVRDRSYVLALMAHVEHYSLEDIHRLADSRTGIQTVCKFPPTIAEIVDFVKGPAIHKWSDGSMRREPERFNHGPNFTQERLRREADLLAQGLSPEEVERAETQRRQEYMAEAREYLKRHKIDWLGNSTEAEWLRKLPDPNDPEWFSKLDSNAPYRKQEPASKELLDDYHKHQIEIAEALNPSKATH